MSLVPIGLAIAQTAALNILSPIFLFQRNIGGFIADATLEESHHDTLTVTRHPVQQGAEITDHSFKNNAEVIIRAAWSDASLQALGDPNFSKVMYANFLELQASRQPFDIQTGKRSYSNMLITSLQETTTEKTENSLVLIIQCRENIFAQTQTITVPSNAVMKDPSSTQAVSNLGTKNLGPSGNFNADATAAARS